MKFKHFLVTRINLGYKERVNHQGHDEKSWLAYRFSIFYRFCFPSVNNQLDKDFLWLIYLDDRTPLHYLEELRSKSQVYMNIVILMRSGGFDDLGSHLSKDILQFIDKDTEYIISTRIDSDDMIHNEYIGEIKKLFDYQEYASINFTYGWVYDDRIKLLGKAKNMSNPFISLIEKISFGYQIKTVFYQSHTDYIHEADRIEITQKKRLWCMTIHGVNDSTQFYGLPVWKYSSQLASQFNFPFIVKPSFYNYFRFYYRYMRRKLIKVRPYLVEKIKDFIHV